LANDRLSQEQQKAVESKEPKLTVVAAAGAGKTRVLVERYLRHVTVDGISPDHLLTITFTRKAAAELRERIVNALRSLGREADAQVAETGPVQTIHSFCERLLRENSVEAGLDAEFEILAESQSARMLQEAIQEALSESLEEFPNAESFISTMAGQRQFNDRRSDYGRLESAIKTVLGTFRDGGVERSRLEQVYGSVESLSTLWRSVVTGLVGEDLGSPIDLSADPLDLEVIKASYKECGKRVPNWLRSKATPETERVAMLWTCGVVQIASIAWQRLEWKMSDQQAFDFSGLEARAVRLLRENPRVRARVRDQYRVVMVDEAQDVNPVQYALLEAIGAEREFMVGDAQQSIYGFRHADVELFRDRTRAGSQKLSRNYRSVPGILAFIDLVFGELWPDTYNPMVSKPMILDLDSDDSSDYAQVELWEYPAVSHPTTARYVSELVREGTRREDIAILVRRAADAASIVEELRKLEIPARVIGGSERFYTRMEIRDLANAMTAAADPYNDFALVSCLRSPVVGLSLDAIVSLAKDRPVIETLVEFVPGIEDDAIRLARFRAWFDPLRTHADRLSAWEVLGQILARSPYMENIARRRSRDQILANVRKLLSLATVETELGPLQFAERIRSIQELRHREGDAPPLGEPPDVVSVMTIHKSKGLEFDTVVIPSTSVALSQRARDIVSDIRHEVVATKYAGAESLMHALLTERQKRKSEQEELRIFYVAMTRAKKRLCVGLYPSGNVDNFSKRLRKIVGDPPHPTLTIRRAGA